MAWSKNGTTTLSSAGDTVTVSSLTASEFNTNLFHGVSSGNIQHRVKIGYTSLDSGNNYARRYSQNGGADGTGTSETIISSNVSVADIFAVHYSINIGTEEKLFIIFTGEQGTAGAGNAPQRMETVAKWSNTSNQYDVIEINNGNTGDFDTGSNLTVLNGDTTEETILGNNVQSGSRFEATDTRKIYYGVLPTADYTDDFSTDNFTDTGSLQYVSGGVLNWASDRESSTSNTYDDMQTRLGEAVDSTAFVIRYKHHITNITQGSLPQGEIIYWTLSTLTNESYSTAGDHVGLQLFVVNNTLNYSLNNKNGVGLAAGNGEVVFSTTPTTGDIWIEWIKNGDNFKINLYSDSTYSTLIESQNYTTSGVTGLRYFRVVNIHGTDPDHSVTGYLDDLQIFNGITSTDFTWTEEV